MVSQKLILYSDCISIFIREHRLGVSFIRLHLFIAISPHIDTTLIFATVIISHFVVVILTVNPFTQFYSCGSHVPEQQLLPEL